MWKKASLTLMLLGGCVPMPNANPHSCPIAKFENLIGTPLEAGVFPLTLDHRIIAPNSMVTMDHVPDRLNIYVNEQQDITRLSCG